jgi:tetratricopeptide (TPR) repeat protein
MTRQFPPNGPGTEPSDAMLRISLIRAGVFAELRNKLKWPELRARGARAARSASSIPAIHILGALHFRLGEYDSAGAVLQEALKLPETDWSQMDVPFLAMTFQKLGRTEEAKKWLNEAIRIEKEKPPRHWKDRLQYQIVCREAEALIIGSATPDKK